jgi:hypothetical protein
VKEWYKYSQHTPFSKRIDAVLVESSKREVSGYSSLVNFKGKNVYLIEVKSVRNSKQKATKLEHAIGQLLVYYVLFRERYSTLPRGLWLVCDYIDPVLEHAFRRIGELLQLEANEKR